MARAISSLPVPVSPRTSTVELVGATRCTSTSADFRAGPWPTISSNPSSTQPVNLAAIRFFLYFQKFANHKSYSIELLESTRVLIANRPVDQGCGRRFHLLSLLRRALYEMCSRFAHSFRFQWVS